MACTPRRGIQRREEVWGNDSNFHQQHVEYGVCVEEPGAKVCLFMCERKFPDENVIKLTRHFEILR